jgi:16S rRNA (adenine1518-N6/adenine1519-N6)-dimethyltransferase
MIKHIAKKSLGQNFLRDPKILKKIADFADIKKEDTVMEVGPGEGTLTKILLERTDKVIAIEKDDKLAELLKEKFKKEIVEGKLEIICGDILKVSKGIFEMPRSQKTPLDTYKLVGNIPYYITGALFKKFLQSENPPTSIIFVMQKEVAERIMARDGKESVLSISIKVYGTPEYGGIIKAGSFNPKPKVDSAIIAVRNISKKRFEDLTPLIPLNLRGKQDTKQKFFEILRKGFSHKRKLLKNNLGVSRSVLDICKIPEKARAETLKVDDWICLTKNLL